MALTLKEVRKIALSLANVEEGTSYGTPAFKVDGRLLARLREDGDRSLWARLLKSAKR